MHIYVKDILSALIERHRLNLVLTLTPPDYDVDAEITFHKPSDPAFFTDLSVQIGAEYLVLSGHVNKSNGELDWAEQIAVYDTMDVYHSNDWAEEVQSKVIGKDIRLVGSGEQASTGKSKVVYAVEFVVPDKFETDTEGGAISIEDSGQAVILDPHPHREFGGDGKFFVRVHSWDDDATEGASGFTDENHQLMRSIMGRRVRITVETID